MNLNQPEQSLLDEGINEDMIYLGRRFDHSSGKKQQSNRLCKSFEHKFPPQNQGDFAHSSRAEGLKSHYPKEAIRINEF